MTFGGLKSSLFVMLCCVLSLLYATEHVGNDVASNLAKVYVMSLTTMSAIGTNLTNTTQLIFLAKKRTVPGLWASTYLPA